MSYINKISVSNNDYDIMGVNSIYDTTERVIGTYFGMPLYRQVFVITSQEYSNLPNDSGRKIYSTGIAFDRLIRADLSIVYTSSEQVPHLKTYAMHNVSTSNNYDCGAHTSKGNGDIAIQIGSAQLPVSKDINLIIEYTKASDISNA